jgi:hypothetical protein
MSKRLVVKVAVAITALGALTLLPGCGEDEDGLTYGFVWAPVGFAPLLTFGPTGATGSVSQSAGGSATSATAGAVSSGMGGGGGTVMTSGTGL